MALITLRQLLDHAAEQGYGVPAFNINNMEQALAIMEAADAADAPVILQASAGARKYAGEPFFLFHVPATTEKDYQRELGRHETLAASAAWRAREEALVEADSITSEQTKRGEAAAHHLRSLRYGVLRRNPQIVGHGVAVEQTAIGQTTRRSGGAK